MFIIGIVYALTISCHQPKSIFGAYLSNFPVNGYHSRLVRLKPDSVLEYRYSGHMIFDTAVARFSLIGNRLSVQYFPISIDTSAWPELRKLGVTGMENENENMGKSAPIGWILRGKKLFLIGENMKVVRNKNNEKGRSRRYFLKRIEKE